jgi:hypothetical protein
VLAKITHSGGGPVLGVLSTITRKGGGPVLAKLLNTVHLSSLVRRIKIAHILVLFDVV